MSSFLLALAYGLLLPALALMVAGYVLSDRAAEMGAVAPEASLVLLGIESATNYAAGVMLLVSSAIAASSEVSRRSSMSRRATPLDTLLETFGTHIDGALTTLADLEQRQAAVAGAHQAAAAGLAQDRALLELTKESAEAVRTEIRAEVTSTGRKERRLAFFLCIVGVGASFLFFVLA
jgi:hypothetical protein